MDEAGFRYERIVTIQLPMPMTLASPLLAAVDKWHETACGWPGCQVVMFGDEDRNWEISHRWPN
jgi:hypothetical protein